MFWVLVPLFLISLTTGESSVIAMFGAFLLFAIVAKVISSIKRNNRTYDEDGICSYCKKLASNRAVSYCCNAPVNYRYGSFVCSKCERFASGICLCAFK
jgi:hypothetical protein